MFLCVSLCVSVCKTTVQRQQKPRKISGTKKDKKKKLINFKEHKQNIYAKNRNKILNTIKQFYTLRIEKRNQKSTSGDKGMSKIY